MFSIKLPKREFGTYALQGAVVDKSRKLDRKIALAITDPLRNIVTSASIGDIGFPAHEQLHIETGTATTSYNAYWYISKKITAEDRKLYGRYSKVIETFPALYEMINTSYRELMEEYRNKIRILLRHRIRPVRMHEKTKRTRIFLELFNILRESHTGDCSNDMIMGIAQRLALFVFEYPSISNHENVIEILSSTMRKEGLKWETSSQIWAFCWKTLKKLESSQLRPFWIRIIEVDEIHNQIAACLQNMFIALAMGREAKYHTANFYALSNFIMRHVYPYNWPFWNVTLAAEKTEINMVKLTSRIKVEEQLLRFNQQFEFLEPFDCPLCAPVSRGFRKFPLPTSPKELQFDAYAELFLIVYDLFSAIQELVVKRSSECPYCKFVLRLLTPTVQETLHKFRLDPSFFAENAKNVPALFHDWCKEIVDRSVVLNIKTGE